MQCNAEGTMERTVKEPGRLQRGGDSTEWRLIGVVEVAILKAGR
jgi:hypothetical protein